MMRFEVKGMTCDGCRGAVERVTKRIPGVQGVRVDLAAASLEVDGDVAESDVVKAVEKAGYSAARAG